MLHESLVAALTMVFTFVVTAAIFVPLELAFPARAQHALRRRELRLDLLFFAGQTLLWGTFAVACVGWLRGLLGDAPLGAVSRLFRRQPFVAQVIEVLVLGDLLVYFWHRACHAVPLLWRFHAVHHSAESLDWVAAFREHPIDGITTQLAQNLPAFLLGFPLAAAAGLVTFRGAWAIFVHSNARLALGWLEHVVGSPVLHRWHHARVPRTAHNFANLAPWIDHLFGTHHRPADEGYALGLTEAYPRSYLGQLAEPLRVAGAEADRGDPRGHTGAFGDSAISP